MRIRNFFPRTLFNRLIIIILLPLLIVQLLTVTVFYVRHWNTVTRHMAQNLVADLSAIISQIEDVNNPVNSKLISLSQKLNLNISWVEEKKIPEFLFSTNTYAEKAFKKSMDQTISLPFKSDFISDEDYITIEVQIEKGVLVFKFNKKRVFSSTSWIFVSWSIGSSLFLFALTLLFVSAQVRPIKRLARTAYNLGIGKQINNIPITGANEVRLATRSVISMASRIRNQMNERTEMLAGVSHDLRTPLTRLKLQLAMLPSNSEITSMSKDIEEMEIMINDYLSFAKDNVTENFSKLNLKDLRSSISLVTQTITLFPGSVLQNIAYGSTNSSKEDIIKAAKVAEIHDFVSSLPEGYDTQIGEGGHKLSGGQRQRISIARAVLKDAPILVLDEATSSVDNETEEALQKSLDLISKDRTTIVIAHRLSTIRHSDSIIVLDEGKVVESGKHEELIENKSHYYRLWNVQTGVRR